MNQDDNLENLPPEVLKHIIKVQKEDLERKEARMKEVKDTWRNEVIAVVLFFLVIIYGIMTMNK
jgi:hypothetical protein